MSFGTTAALPFIGGVGVATRVVTVAPQRADPSTSSTAIGSKSPLLVVAPTVANRPPPPKLPSSSGEGPPTSSFLGVPPAAVGVGKVTSPSSSSSSCVVVDGRQSQATSNNWCKQQQQHIQQQKRLEEMRRATEESVQVAQQCNDGDANIINTRDITNRVDVVVSHQECMRASELASFPTAAASKVSSSNNTTSTSNNININNNAPPIISAEASIHYHHHHPQQTAMDASTSKNVDHKGATVKNPSMEGPTRTISSFPTMAPAAPSVTAPPTTTAATTTTTVAKFAPTSSSSVAAVTTKTPTNNRLISMLVCSTLLHGYYFSHLAMGVTLLPLPKKSPQLVALEREARRRHRLLNNSQAGNESSGSTAPDKNNIITNNHSSASCEPPCSSSPPSSSSTPFPESSASVADPSYSSLLPLLSSLKEGHRQARLEHLTACVSAHPASIVLAALKRPSDAPAQAAARRLSVVSCPFYGPQRIRCLDVLYGRGMDGGSPSTTSTPINSKRVEGEDTARTRRSHASGNNNTNNNNDNNSDSISNLFDGAKPPSNVLEAARRELAAAEWRIHCEKYKSLQLLHRGVNALEEQKRAAGCVEIGGKESLLSSSASLDSRSDVVRSSSPRIRIPPLPPPSLAPSPTDPDPFTPQILKRYLHPSFLPLYAFDIPSVPLVDFVEHLMTQFRCGAEGVVMALCLLAKLPPNHVPICDRSVHRMFLTALVLSCKLLTDQRIAMKVFSSVGGVTSADLISMEWAFLTAIDFDATVSTAMYVDMIFSLRQHCSTLSHASSQIKKANAAAATAAALSAQTTQTAAATTTSSSSCTSSVVGHQHHNHQDEGDADGSKSAQHANQEEKKKAGSAPQQQQQQQQHSITGSRDDDSTTAAATLTVSTAPICRGKRDLLNLSRSSGGGGGGGGGASVSLSSQSQSALREASNGREASTRLTDATATCKVMTSSRGGGGAGEEKQTVVPTSTAAATPPPPKVHLMSMPFSSSVSNDARTCKEAGANSGGSDGSNGGDAGLTSTSSGLQSVETTVTIRQSEEADTRRPNITPVNDDTKKDTKNAPSAERQQDSFSITATATTATKSLTTSSSSSPSPSDLPAPRVMGTVNTIIEDPYAWAPASWKALIETLPVPATAVLKRELRAVIVEVVKNAVATASRAKKRAGDAAGRRNGEEGLASEEGEGSDYDTDDDIEMGLI